MEEIEELEEPAVLAGSELLIKYPQLLDILLLDRTTGQNLLWASDDYAYLGEEYYADKYILSELITGDEANIIIPRSDKSREIQLRRSKDKGEVFTPAWLCNKQNNLFDNEWLGYENAFNTEIEPSECKGNVHGWITNPNKVDFHDPNKIHPDIWQKYVKLKRMEITCGEAPYLTSRYDAVNGIPIMVPDRIGILDRKLRVINERVRSTSETTWHRWARPALQSVYAFDFQGDNVLLARQNVLCDVYEYYAAKFSKEMPLEMLLEFAEIVSWNIWQMDGLKGTVPFSCHDEIEYGSIGFDFEDDVEQKKITPCYGCQKNDIHKHNGVYCLIKTWEQKDKKIIRYVDLLK